MVIKDVPIPEPGPNQFLVKMACASLCHSDIMAIEAGQTATLGHEGAGYIEQIHPSVENKGYEKGDKVGFMYIIGCCFECEGCMVRKSMDRKIYYDLRPYSDDQRSNRRGVCLRHMLTVLPIDFRYTIYTVQRWPRPYRC